MSLRSAMYNIWRPDYERKGISQFFKPIFIRYIGVEDPAEYQNILLTLKHKADDTGYTLMFDGQIPMQAEFDIITYVGNELKTMDIRNLKTQDIELFPDAQKNSRFLESLDRVVNTALDQETFFNDSSRNDFILKLIVWTYSYVRPLKEDADHSPKCIYFGDISKHEIYFLMMLSLMGFDVLYINPLREENWEVETLGISECHKNAQILPIQPFEKMTEGGHVIEGEESITLQYEQQVADEVLAGTGAFRAWQYRDGNTSPLFIKASIHDIPAMWKEPARLRMGFKIQGKTVTIPSLFFQIDGMDSNPEEYAKRLELCLSQPNTMVIEDAGRTTLLGTTIPQEEKLKLTFCMLSDGTFDINEIKKLPFYEWDKYRDALEDFMLGKLNALFADRMFKKVLSRDDKFDIICDVLSMNQQIIKMADGFDYTDKIPKLVIFLNNEDFIEDRVLYLIGFIWQMGFDIVIFSPSGLISIDSVFNTDRFNLVRLDEMKYDMTLEKAKKKRGKGGIFGKLFG